MGACPKQELLDDPEHVEGPWTLPLETWRMKLACPNCGTAVSLGDRACAHCGTAFSPTRIIGFLWRDFAGWCGRLTALRCPACEKASPFRAKSCVHCGQKMTLGAAVEVTMTPYRTRWRRFIDEAGPKTMRAVQWAYVALSLVGLWALLGYTEERTGPQWIWQALFSVVYLAAFGLLGAVLVPRTVWISIARGTSALMKAGLVANYLSVLLLLNVAIGAWWSRAMMLAALFSATWIAIWVVCRFLWPVYLDASNLIFGARQRPFDPSSPQGRSARIE